MAMIKVLLLTLNLVDIDSSHLHEKMQSIETILRQSEFHSQFTIRSHWAHDLSEIKGLLSGYQPDIIHINICRNNSDKVAREEEQGQGITITISTLGELCRILNTHIRCIVLDTCYSVEQAASIADCADCVISLSNRLLDMESIEFAVTFYQALGAGHSVAAAFKQGCNQINLNDTDATGKVQLFSNRNPALVRFIVTGSVADKEAAQALSATQIGTGGGAAITGNVNIHDGDFVARDKYNISNLFQVRPQWETAIWDFLQRDWLLIILILIGAVASLALYVQYKDLHQISWGVYWVTTLLLSMLIGSIYAHWRLWRIHGLFTISVAIILLIIISRQVWAILSPLHFDDQVLSVAVATIGQNSDFKGKADSSQATQQIVDYLCSMIKADIRDDGCITNSITPTREIRRIGIIRDASIAKEFGGTINADIIMWGEFINPSKPELALHIYAIKPLDYVFNPELIRLPPSAATHSDYANLNELAWLINVPPPFEQDVFGVALAALGEGPDYQQTAEARIINQQIFLSLCNRLKAQSPSEDTCSGTLSSSNKKKIVIRNVSTVRDLRSTGDYGKKIGAELLLWGQIINGDPGAFTIRFRILETLDQIANPNFSVVLPVTANSVDLITTLEKDIQSTLNSAEYMSEVSLQSHAIEELTLGTYAYLEQNFAEARRHFESLNGIVADAESLGISKAGQALLYYYLGRTAQFRGEVEEGQDWLIKAGELNKDEPAIPLSLAWGYQYLEDPERFKQSIQAASTLIINWYVKNPVRNDNNELAYDAASFDKGLIHYLNGEFREQSEILEQIIADNENFYSAYISLGEAYAKFDELTKAEETLRNAINLAQRNNINATVAHRELAKVLTQANRFEEAEKEYKLAIALKPDLIWNHYFYAEFLKKTNRPEAALKEYEKAVELFSTSSWLYRVLGDFQTELNLLDEAESSYNHAIEYDQKNFLAQIGLARIFEKKADIKNAEKHYLDALDIKPNDVFTLVDLAVLYAESGEIPKALELFEKAISISGTSDADYVYSKYGETLYSLGQYNDAIEMFSKALAINSNSYDVMLNIATIYSYIGNPIKACPIYKELLDNEEVNDEIRELALQDFEQQCP